MNYNEFIRELLNAGFTPFGFGFVKYESENNGRIALEMRGNKVLIFERRNKRITRKRRFTFRRDINFSTVLQQISLM